MFKYLCLQIYRPVLHFTWSDIHGNKCKKLIVIEKALEDTEYKFEIIKEIGKFIILKVDEPVYVLYKYEENTSRIQVKRQIKHYKRLWRLYYLK